MSFSVVDKFKNISLSPVMVLVGGDSLIREKIRKGFEERSLGDSIRDMNYSKFQGGEDDIKQVVDACREYPCFAERRVVYLAHAEKLRKKESSELITYLKDPQPNTTFLVEAAKLDGRLDWVKALKKIGEYLEVPDLSGEDCLEWLRSCFKKEGKKPGAGVPEMLLDWIGPDLGSLEQAALQCCLYIGEDSEVGSEVIEKNFVKISDENIFEVIDSLFSGRLLQLNRSLGRLLQSGEAPLKILALLYRHLAILLSLRYRTDSQSGNLLRMPPWARRGYEDQVRKYGTKLSYSLLSPISQADWELKSSPIPNSAILKNCVDKISAMLH